MTPQKKYGRPPIEALPHEGDVVLDRVGPDTWVVTHLRTYEVKLVHATKPQVCFGDEDCGVQDCPSLPGLLSLDEPFRFLMYRGSCDNEYIKSCGAGAQEQVVALPEFKWHFVALEAPLRLGPAKALNMFSIVIYRWHLFLATKTLWRAKTIYRELGLTPFKGEQRRWVSGSQRR